MMRTVYALAVIIGLCFTLTTRSTPAYADAVTVLWDVKFCVPESAVIGNADGCGAVDVLGGGGPSTAYDYVAYFYVDPPGPGGTPVQPLFDTQLNSWDGTLQVIEAASTGAVVGELDFHAQSNAPGSVNPFTGALDRCGTTPTGVGGNELMYAGVRAPTVMADMSNPAQFQRNGRYVQSFDDDDGDLLEYIYGFDPNGDPIGGPGGETAETQEDGINLNPDADGDFDDPGEVRPNGILDGVERMPDFLPRLYNAIGIGPLVSAGNAGRSYARVGVLAGVSTVDMNVVILDLNLVGVPGYASMTIFGVIDPTANYNPTVVPQSLFVCSPYQSSTTTFGMSRDNASTSIAGPEMGAQCLNGIDDNLDGAVNDGCPADGGPENIAAGHCLLSNLADDDMDTFINDGCPDVTGDESDVFLRAVTGDFNFVNGISSIEDYDGDGVAATVDRCLLDATGLDEPDSDQVSGACDNRTNSADNCDAAGPALPCPRNEFVGFALQENSSDTCADLQMGIYISADDDNDGFPNDGCPASGAAESGAACQNALDDAPLDGRVNDGCPIVGVAENGVFCTTTVEAVGFEGGSAQTSYPWDLDEDVDCDGAANFADNCPLTYNPLQRDHDGDALGNACEAAPLENACSGDGSLIGPAPYFPCWLSAQGHDHDLTCNDPVSAAAGSTEGADVDAIPPFGEGVCTTSQDSSDDGVRDLAAAIFFPGAVGGHQDINSDSDYDGCPDKDEVDGDTTCGAANNPYNADQNSNSIIDGAEDWNGNGTADWRDSVGDEPQTTSTNLNDDGSPDSDSDGCSNRRESLANDQQGGNRDALNPYDFLDVPVPATVPGADGRLRLHAGSVRNRAVNLLDVAVIQEYVSRTATNQGASYYNGDYNNDGMPDGRQLDRTPGAGNAENPGNLAISLQDVGVALDHVNDVCIGP